MSQNTDFKHEKVVLVFDRNGKFYKFGFDQELLEVIAKEIKGFVKVIENA